MIKFLKDPRSWIVASFLAGLCLVMTGWTWLEHTTPQTDWFNRGLLAYNTGNYDVAVQDFDRSYNEYVAAGGDKAVNPDMFTPAASLAQASDAQFFKFMSLLKMKNAKLALIAVREALKLTTDEHLKQFSFTDAQLAEIKAERFPYQTDLEILFHQKKEMQDAEGKGKGNGQPKPGDKQSEDPSSGQSAGKTPRDAL